MTSKTDKRLCAVFEKALAADDVELRDMIVTYIVLIDYVEGIDVLIKYVKSEKLAWLKDYTYKVIKHLKYIRAGKPSKPPTVSDLDDTIVGIKKR